MISAWDNPPWEIDRSFYHEADPMSGNCCCRNQFEGESHKHLADYKAEAVGLQTKLSDTEARMKSWKRHVSQGVA